MIFWFCNKIVLVEDTLDLITHRERKLKSASFLDLNCFDPIHRLRDIEFFFEISVGEKVKKGPFRENHDTKVCFGVEVP